MSVYDVKIKSVDGEEDFLNNFKGKVSLIINVTGDCGNAPQYGVIETIYRKYKDKGFEVIAIPTNDYCGVGLTYGDHVYGTDSAESAREFAKTKYGVTYGFTELIESNPCESELIPGLPSKHGKVTPHEVYNVLCKMAEDLSQKDPTSKGGTTLGGNFEKYLVGKNGKLLKNYDNGALLNYSSQVSKPDIEYIKICKDIENALAE